MEMRKEMLITVTIFSELLLTEVHPAPRPRQGTKTQNVESTGLVV